MFEILLLISLFFYAYQIALAVYGLYRTPRLVESEETPAVTLIVACRNEEANIGRCLASLVAVDYPHDRLEIIISDGASQDATCHIVEEYAAKFPFVQLHKADQSRRIKGKGNAIHQAVELAKGEIILMTDADCTVQPTWVKETLKYFRPEVGLVGGYTIPQGKKIFDKIQTLDWCCVLSLSGGLLSSGVPITAIGNNFCFRKKAYEDVGGYESVKFSITEDYALFKAIWQLPQWKVIYPMNQFTFNTTQPMPTLRELYEQKKRWTLGGLDASGLSMAVGIVTLAAHLAVLLGFVFLPVGLAFYYLMLKFIFDFALIYTAVSRFRKGRALGAFLAWQVYYFTFVFTAAVVLATARKVVWKGIEYSVK
jgi:1,2-diacylglycerol 3-beta-glucosyltransferase